jgi:hypothetical protein
MAVRMTTSEILVSKEVGFVQSVVSKLTGVLLLVGEELGNLVTNLTIGHANIVLGLTIIGHQGQEAIVGDVEKLEFATLDVGDIHVVGRGAEIFELLASEDINGDQMDLGVTVLSSLGGGHVDDLARALLDADEAVLAQSRTLHGEGVRSTGVSRGLEGVIMGRVVSHLDLAVEQSGKLVLVRRKKKGGRMEWMDDGLSGFPTPKELKGWRGKEKCQ